MRRGHGAGWDELAALDPLWAILGPGRGGADLDGFFATGEAELAEVLDTLAALGLPASGRALDFGCGLGRVTRAMGAAFEACVGVDVSGRMVARARELNADRPACAFVAAPSLAGFETGSFDFVYSRLVLQHLPRPAGALAAAGELVRVARPGGVVVFQLPWHVPWRDRVQARRRLWALARRAGVPPGFLYRRVGLHPVGLVAVPERDVRAAVERAGGEIVLAEPDDAAAPPARSLRYVVRVSASTARRASSASTEAGSRPREARTT